jgi:Lar family restriction alleviation protein
MMTDTTHEAPDLLPCPFCGGEAKFYHRPDDSGWSNTDWVSCAGDCGASTCMHETKQEAIAAWNTRSDDLIKERSDEVQAAVAAALREAAAFVSQNSLGWRFSSPWHGRDFEKEILALIPKDAQAALDRVRREAWVEGSDAGWLVGIAAEQERCAQVAFDAGCGWQALRTAALSSSWPEDAAKHLASEHAAFAIAATIREGSNERSEEGE